MDSACFQNRLRDLENRIRKWKLLRLGFVESRLRQRDRRSNSADHKRFVKAAEAPSTSKDAVPQRPTNIGCLTSPMERKRRRKKCSAPALGLPMEPSPSRRDPEFEAVERRYQEARANSGYIRVLDQTVKVSIADIIYDEKRDRIGGGTCGTVHRVSCKAVSMAMKTMMKTSDKLATKRILQDLVIATQQIESLYIVRCHGYILLDSTVKVFMELMAKCCERLLRRIVPEKKVFPEYVAGRIAFSVINALHYLKENHAIIHRDIKPSNILFDWNGNVKLCDFGISGYLINSRAHTIAAGCPPYMAPERLDPAHSSNYDVRSDIWSLGITLIQLVTGRYPYPYDPNQEIDTLLRITNMDEPSPTLATKDGFSLNFVEFIDKCLIKNFERRPKYLELQMHSFYQEYDPENEKYKICLIDDIEDEVEQWLRVMMNTTPETNERLPLPHTPNTE